MRLDSTTSLRTPGAASLSPSLAKRSLGIVAAAVATAVAAQIAVPMWPVPMTLQPLAVVAAGGLLGAGAGATSMTLYLAAGLLGAPVFSHGMSGLPWVMGPTGGYLLAFPFAAWLTGLLVAGRSPLSLVRATFACLAGIAVIHLGGLAQLALLGRDMATAVATGTVPFLAGDLLKTGIAAMMLKAFRR